MSKDLGFTFSIFGRPVSKKNNSRIIKLGSRYSLIPSKAYCAYEKECLIALKNVPVQFKDSYLQVCCEYWLQDHRWFPDLSNLISATHDILQKSGIIDNDKFIVSVDGSRIMGFDKKNPRVDVTICRLNNYEYKEVSNAKI